MPRVNPDSESAGQTDRSYIGFAATRGRSGRRDRGAASQRGPYQDRTPGVWCIACKKPSPSHHARIEVTVQKCSVQTEAEDLLSPKLHRACSSRFPYGRSLEECESQYEHDSSIYNLELISRLLTLWPSNMTFNSNAPNDTALNEVAIPSLSRLCSLIYTCYGYCWDTYTRSIRPFGLRIKMCFCFLSH